MKLQSFTNDIHNPSGRLVFVVATLLVGCFYVAFFFLSTRIPLGHDTLQYLQLQYTFLNDLVVNGEIPLWFPFMTKGTVTNVWFVIQNGLLNNLFYPLAPYLKDSNYYYLFYLSLFFDELILLLGTFLLASTLYRNKWAVLFVLITTMGTVNWASQIWFNFHIYYMMPLVLFLYLRAFREKSLASFAAGNFFLFLWSFYGNLIYFLPVLSFFIFLFFLSYIVCHTWKGISVAEDPQNGGSDVVRVTVNLSFTVARRFVRSIRNSLTVGGILKILAILLVGAIPIFILYKYVTQCGAGEIAYHNIDRDKTGMVTLTTFLTYGGLANYSRYIELLSGITTNLDNNIYLGGLTICLCFLQIVYLFKKIDTDKVVLAFLVTSVLMISFSAGGFVASLAYFSWPLMKFFRHIGLIGPIIKTLAIFIGGFAVDRILSFMRSNDMHYMTMSLKYAGVFFVIVLSVKLFYLLFPETFFWEAFSAAATQFTVFKIVSFAVVLLFLVMISLKRRFLLARRVEVLLLLFLLLHGIELITYRATYYDVQLPHITTDRYLDTLTFKGYEFPPERSQAYENNLRYASFNEASLIHQDLPNRSSWGALYWNSESFFFIDSCSTPFRADHRLVTVDDFYRVYQEKPERINVERPLPKNESFLKILGCHYPKLQGFKAIHFTKQPWIYMGNPLYHGDILFTDTSTSATASVLSLPDDASNILQANERVDLALTVRHFSANRLTVEVNNPSASSAILHYADASHKYWKAAVNGNRADILRSNLGFKAIEVPPGASTVEFFFRKLKVIAAIYFLIALGIIGFAIIVYYILEILLEPRSLRQSALKFHAMTDTE